MSLRDCVPIFTTENINVSNSDKVIEHKAFWEHAVNGIFIGVHRAPKQDKKKNIHAFLKCSRLSEDVVLDSHGDADC